jgi:hypothetical protein
VDIFCPSDHVLVATIQKLLHLGYTMDDRHARVWFRWLRYGFKKWHTNSMRMMSPAGIETNLVYKLSEGHPTTSLSQVLESFDFGLLGMGYELETGQYRDLRPYLFPTLDINGPLPMMPNKQANWAGGYISQYNGLREAGRYAKYHNYGYDMSLVRDQLLEGYQQGWLYLSTHFDQEKQQLGEIYSAIAKYIEFDDIDGLDKASKLIDYSDSLDAIMAVLE